MTPQEFNPQEHIDPAEKWTVFERIGRPIGYTGLILVEIGRSMSPGGNHASTGELGDGPSRETCGSLGKAVVSGGALITVAGGAAIDHFIFGGTINPFK